MVKSGGSRSALLFTVVVIGVILFLICGMIVGISGDNESEIWIRQIDKVPDGAEIIPMTDEIFEKYPVLNGMPEKIQIRVSLYSEIFRDEFSVDKETGDEILNLFCYTPTRVCMEYDGKYYDMHNPIS